MPSVKEEIRESKSGGRKATKLANFADIPPQPLWALAERFGIGRAKYPEEGTGPISCNWMKGLPYSSLYGALHRHAVAFWSGEDIDEQVLEGLEHLGIEVDDMDGGQYHLAAVAWHALCLLHYSLNPEEYAEYDDRHPLSEFK